MIWRTWNNQGSCLHNHDEDEAGAHPAHHHSHDHAHEHEHDHAVHNDHSHAKNPTQNNQHCAHTKTITTSEALLKLELVNNPSAQLWHFKLLVQSADQQSGQSSTSFARDFMTDHAMEIVLERPDGRLEHINFSQRNGVFESLENIAEPHEFILRMSLTHNDHHHNYDLEYTEHQHAIAEYKVLDVAAPGYQDPHELAHANDIRHRFGSKPGQQEISNGQIIMFGLTGGLMPCPAAISVLLLCLQLKKVSLGAGLVVCFSIGLALTLVMSGVIAAIGVRHASKRFSGFSGITSFCARNAPYLSSGVLLIIGSALAIQSMKTLFG